MAMDMPVLSFRQLSHLIQYPIIEELFKQAGPANMKIIQESERVSAEVRKCVLLGVMPDTHPDLFERMKRFFKSGQIIPKYDGRLLIPACCRLHFI